MKPWNHEIKKPVDISLSKDGVHGEIIHETMKPWKQETYQQHALQICSAWRDKPWNHETKKSIDNTLSRYVVNVEKTMKPWNHETKKPVDISLSRDGVHGEINHETTKPVYISLSTNGVHGEISHETMKPQVSFSKTCHNLSSKGHYLTNISYDPRHLSPCCQ